MGDELWRVRWREGVVLNAGSRWNDLSARWWWWMRTRGGMEVGRLRQQRRRQAGFKSFRHSVRSRAEEVGCTCLLFLPTPDLGCLTSLFCLTACLLD
jgi:hypothetical protein